MATVKIAVISLLFLFSDAARYPNTVDENLVVSRDAPDTSAVALIQPPEKQEAKTEPNETVALVLRPVGNKETETESSLPLDKKEKATSVSLPKLVYSFEHLRPFRLCHPRRHRHRFRGVDVVPLTFGDDVTSSRKLGEEEGDSTEEAAKHTVTVTSTTEVGVHEESVINREAAEGDQGAKKESRAQKEEEEAKATPTKIILPESNEEGENGGRKKKEPKKKKDQEDSDSDSDSDDDMEKEMKKRKRKRKGGWWKWFWGLWD